MPLGSGPGSAFFVAGLLISEVWFGSAAQADLQPNIDGLSRDEALLARHRPIHSGSVHGRWNWRR
jgi:hypothetical protein